MGTDKMNHYEESLSDREMFGRRCTFTHRVRKSTRYGYHMKETRQEEYARGGEGIIIGVRYLPEVDTRYDASAYEMDDGILSVKRVGTVKAYLVVSDVHQKPFYVSPNGLKVVNDG